MRGNKDVAIDYLRLFLYKMIEVTTTSRQNISRVGTRISSKFLDLLASFSPSLVFGSNGTFWVIMGSIGTAVVTCELLLLASDRMLVVDMSNLCTFVTPWLERVLTCLV